MHWNLLTADFQREYRIDLTAELFTLSYHRFLALISGLSGESVFWAVIAKDKKVSNGGRQPVKRLTTREEVANFFRQRNRK